MHFDIITIFPRLFDSFTKEALIARAIKKKIIRITPHNLRKWTRDNHQTVDGRPYGGGAGMVMMVEPIMKAVAELKKLSHPSLEGRGKGRVILFSAKGKKFNQAAARRWAKYNQLIFICGRYEGIDERVASHIADEEISIGDYVLFGGEVPAMAVMEAVTRLLPGAIGKEESIKNESFSEGFLEHPHYTRPEAIKISGKVRKVPKVLLSGNHKLINEWRKEHSLKMTKKFRPNLLKK